MQNLKFMLGATTLGSKFMLLVGLLLSMYGGWNLYRYRILMFGAGLLFTGIGTVLCGVTNVFTDYSHTGRLLTRIGIIAYLCGLPMLFYYLWR